MPWEPWMTVAALGIGGGFVGTFLPAGMDVPVPGPFKELIGARPKALIVYHLLRNLICGGLASVLTWVLYMPASGGSGPLTPLMAVASVITGGAGVTVVSALFAGAAKDRVIASLGDTVRDLLTDEIRQRLPPPAPPGPEEQER